MKLFKLSLLALSLLSIVSFIFIQSCSQDDDVKAAYKAQLQIAWEGAGFPDIHGPDCRIDPCACFESFNVTVSKLIVRRIDVESDPFDLLNGQSLTFDSKAYMSGNSFIPGEYVTMEPGVYEIMSITMDHIEASPDLNGDANMNQELNAGLPAEASLDLRLGTYCSNSFNLQEGWQKTLLLQFGCSDSVRFNQYTNQFSLIPTILATEPQCQ